MDKRIGGREMKIKNIIEVYDWDMEFDCEELAKLKENLQLLIDTGIKEFLSSLEHYPDGTPIHVVMTEQYKQLEEGNDYDLNGNPIKTSLEGKNHELEEE